MVPASLVACVATYLAGVYVAFVIAGWQGDGDEMDGLDAFAAILWPITLPLAVCVIVGDTLSDWCRGWAERHPVSVRRIVAVLSGMTLPLRPWRIGKKLRGRI